MEKDHRDGQKVIATIEIENRGQDFIEVDVLENGVLLGNSPMFSHGRLSLLGIGTDNGTKYHDFHKLSVVKYSEWQLMGLSGLTIYMKDTGEKDPLPWKAATLKYPVVLVKRPVKAGRFIKK